MTTRRFIPLLLALPLIAIFALSGCGSSDNSNNNGGLTDVTISLTQAQDVSRVTVFQQDGNQFNSIFTQDYNGQSTIDIPLQLVTGDTYRVEAQITDPSTGDISYSDKDFVAGSDSSVNFRSQQSGPQRIILSVPQAPVASAATRLR
ncbi:MAG TPA: hypothetical protein VFJ58_22190 [Armatimonadota bacterium]|nr:hypothetical protein [Armatimonadota bacterium]